MEYPTKFTAVVLMLFFAGFCFSQTETTPRKSSLDHGGTPQGEAAAAQPKSAEEEQILPSAPGAIFPSVVARVNGEAVLGRDLDDLVRSELIAIGNPEWKNLRGEYRGELTLNKITLLINSKLLSRKAAASGIKATDAEIKSEVQKIAKAFRSEDEMNDALLKKNMDRRALEKVALENVITSKYVEETIHKKIVVTPEELQKHYSNNLEESSHPEMVRTSQILIKALGDGTDKGTQAKERAEDLLGRIQKGEDFAKLARENSMDPSASNGGDIGFTSREGLAPEYSDAIFSLPLGSVKLVQNRDGYRIIKVTDKKSEGVFTLEEIKPQLLERLRDQKVRDKLNELINQLRENAKIEILISVKELLDH